MMATLATLATPLLGSRDSHRHRQSGSSSGSSPSSRSRAAGLVLLVSVFSAVVLFAAPTSRLRHEQNADLGGPLPLTDVHAHDHCRHDARNEAGYIQLPDKSDDHYFYWYFESRGNPSTDPLVLWLSGGPGCSSLYTLLTENGPCSVSSSLVTARNPFSWNSEANVIWLDQPTDVGYSYGDVGDYDHSEDDVQANIYQFLQRFMEKHPELERRPLFIMGESYAGHYVPAAAHYIWLENNSSSDGDKSRLNLQGIAIGNGLVNPSVQSKHGLDMINNTYNVTLMDPSTLAKAQEALPQCTRLIDDCQRNTTTCLEAAIFCESNVEAAFSASGRNAFDIRQQCNESDPMNCYAASAVTQYLNSDATRAYLNVSNGSRRKTWASCSTAVAMGFAFDVMKRFDGYVADLLDHASVRVLIYHGDADLVCNWHGGLAWTRELEWSHRAEFNRAPERPFLVDGGGHYHSTTQAGVIHAYKDRLTFLRAFNAGHFMPMDQPAAALEMVTRFLKGVEL